MLHRLNWARLLYRRAERVRRVHGLLAALPLYERAAMLMERRAA